MVPLGNHSMLCHWKQLLVFVQHIVSDQNTLNTARSRFYTNWGCAWDNQKQREKQRDLRYWICCWEGPICLSRFQSEVQLPLLPYLGFLAVWWEGNIVYIIYISLFCFSLNIFEFCKDCQHTSSFLPVPKLLQSAPTYDQSPAWLFPKLEKRSDSYLDSCNAKKERNKK